MNKLTISLFALLCALSTHSESKPPLDWREPVRQQIADELAALDPVLLLGCAIETQHYFRNGQYYGLPITSDQKKAVTVFEEFIHDDGVPMVEKLLAGEPLSPENQKYEILVHAYIVHQAFRGRNPSERVENWDAFKAYATKTERAGQAVLRKAYTGKDWTQEDVDTLRLFGFWVDAKCTMAMYMPYHLNLTTSESQLSQGNMPPRLIAARPQVYWEKSSFNNQGIFDPLYTLNEDYMNQFFHVIEGLNPGKKPTHRHGLQFEDFEKENLFTLDQFKGEKPVLLAFVGPTDAWNWHGKLVSWLDVMEHAYGDQVEIALIATTVHDSIMGSRDYFGPLVGGSPKMPAPHPPTIEERARRVKMFYMNFPHFTLHYYLDNIHQTLRDTFRDQGGNCHIFIINKDGTIAAHHRTSSTEKYVRLGAYKDWLKLPDHLHIRANEQEQVLYAMLQNDGQLPKGFSFQYDQIEQGDIQWERFALWLKGSLYSLDDDSLTVIGTVDPDQMLGYHLWKNATEDTYIQNSDPQYSLPVVEQWIEKEGGKPVRTFSLEDNTVVTLNGRHANLSDLQEGDTIGAFYKCDDDDKSAIPALLIRATRL